MLPISPAWNPFWEGLKRHIFRLGFEVRWAYINVPSVGCIVEGNFGWGRESKRFWQTQSYHVQRIWVPFWRHPIIFKRRPSKTAFCNRSKPPPEYWHTQRKQSQPQQGETPWGKCAPLPRISILLPSKRRLLLGVDSPKSWSWTKKTWQKSDASNDLPQIGGVNKENLADTSEANSRTPKHIIDGWMKCTRQPTTSFELRLWKFPSYSWFKNQTTLRIEFHFKRNNK